MKLLVIMFILVAFTTASSSNEGALLDVFDFEAILSNDEQRKIIFDCVLDVKPCGDLQKLKDDSIKLVQTKCANCTPNQKEKFNRIMEIVHEKYENQFKEFVKKLAIKE